MQLKNMIGSLVVAAAVTAGASGCVARVGVAAPAPVAVVEVDEEPPPPREVMVVRPGFVAIEGRWVRMNGRWDWRPGSYERERVGFAWEAGRWEVRGNRHVWVDGRWREGGHREVRR